MMLTRRQFLQRTSAFAALFGLAQGGSAEPAPMHFTTLAHGATFGVPPESSLLGRLFRATDVRLKPQATAKALKQLPAESLHPLLGVSADGWWYQIAEGYLPRESMQPILPYAPPPRPTELHTGYYEVIAPSTTLRTACTPYAAVVGRHAFGSVMYVHDWLTDDRGQVWYALTAAADGSGTLGWANALHFQRWRPQPSPLSLPTLWLDAAQQTLSLYDGETFIGKTAIHAPILAHGTAKMQLGLPAARAAKAPYLHMWQMLLTPQHGRPLPTYGVNWHNRFGMPSDWRNVELPILAARRLYEMLGGAPVREIAVVIG